MFAVIVASHIRLRAMITVIHRDAVHRGEGRDDHRSRTQYDIQRPIFSKPLSRLILHYILSIIMQICQYYKPISVFQFYISVKFPEQIPPPPSRTQSTLRKHSRFGETTSYWRKPSQIHTKAMTNRNDK